MAGAELGGEQRIHGERQEAGGGGHAVALQNDRAVVQWGAGTEQSCQQFVGEMGVERDSALDVGTQADLAFDDDQRPV